MFPVNYMKNQALFSSKDKSKKIKMSSAAIFCLVLYGLKVIASLYVTSFDLELC